MRYPVFLVVLAGLVAGSSQGCDRRSAPSGTTRSPRNESPMLDSAKPSEQTKDAGEHETSSLGVLETRDRVIVIQSGPNGRVYTVKSKKGEILGKELSAHDVHARFPGLIPVIDSGHAKDEKDKDIVIDASTREKNSISRSNP